MPKISDLDYVSEIDATSYLLGIKGGEAVRFPASVLQGEDPVVNTTFIGQGDTPDSYAGQAGKMAAVNTAEDALEFIDAPTSLPVGGTVGQVLTKQSVTDGDAGWDDPSGGTEIAIGTTPPASPVDGQLWIDETQGVQDQNNFIDVTNFTTDYPLRRGETAIVNYSAATSVPLHIKTVEGVYELSIVGLSIAANPTNGDVGLSPNNTTYTGAILREQIYHIFGGTTLTAEHHAQNAYYMGYGALVYFSGRVSTVTANKFISGDGVKKHNNGTKYQVKFDATWEDTTTAWASLGTLTFPYAQSGAIIIRRIY